MRDTDRRLLRKTPCDPKAHRLVKFIDEESERSGISLSALSDRAGVDSDMIRSWRRSQHGNPHILSLEAVLGALGYELRPVRKDEPKQGLRVVTMGTQKI